MKDPLSKSDNIKLIVTGSSFQGYQVTQRSKLHVMYSMATEEGNNLQPMFNMEPRCFAFLWLIPNESILQFMSFKYFLYYIVHVELMYLFVGNHFESWYDDR